MVSLPPELTSFVGREQELAELHDMAMEHRMLTLMGTGGSGKSRLAVHLARALAPRFRGPVAFVPLAQIGEVDGAVYALAEALELSGAITSWDEATAMLRPQNALIVWDNAEHLPQLAERLAALRDACDRLHCVVTSRRPVGVQGEQLYPVEPLDDDAAVTLLVDRALQYQPHYDAEASVTDLRRIATQLDGLPLALELAAARLRSLPAGAMVERLDRQLDLLTDASGEHPERHRTIRAALEWSYELLPPGDQELFQGIAVFGGPARLEPIGRVAGVDDVEALDGLARLIDANLVRLRDADPPRYWMLEPVRQFAAEKMRAGGREETMRERMFEWYAARAAALESLPEPSLREFRNERDNLLPLYAFGGDTDRWDDVVGLAWRSSGVFYIGGTSALLIPWLDDVQSHRDLLTPLGRARLAMLDERPGELTPRVKAEQGAELGRKAGEPLVLGELLLSMSLVCVSDGDLDAATDALDEAASLRGVSSNTTLNIHLTRAEIADMRGDPIAASLRAEGEAIARATGDAVNIVRALWSLIHAALADGEAGRALALATEALGADPTWESWLGTELALRYVASVAAVLNDQPGTAANHLQRSLVLFERVGASDRYFDLPHVMLATAALLARTGRLEPAAALYNWAWAQLEIPAIDSFALGRQRALLERALDGVLYPDEPLDRELALRMAFDEVAAVIEAR